MKKQKAVTTVLALLLLGSWALFMVFLYQERSHQCALHKLAISHAHQYLSELRDVSELEVERKIARAQVENLKDSLPLHFID